MFKIQLNKKNKENKNIFNILRKIFNKLNNLIKSKNIIDKKEIDKQDNTYTIQNNKIIKKLNKKVFKWHKV